MWNAKTRSQFVIVLFSALQAGATVYFQPLLLLPFRVYPVFWLGESLLGPAVCHILVYYLMRYFRNSRIKQYINYNHITFNDNTDNDYDLKKDDGFSWKFDRPNLQY